jgi:hypothetical protein
MGTDIPAPTDSTNRMFKSNKMRFVQHVARRELKIYILF